MRPPKVILLVDSNEQTLSVRKFLLETRGHYDVIPATTAQEALEVLVQKDPGKIDLLIYDLFLPDMNRNELVRQAKKMHPMLPVLMRAVKVPDPALMANAYFSEGCSAADLLASVRVMVARKRGPKPKGRDQSPTYGRQESGAARL